MYFPVGWPKTINLNFSSSEVKEVNSLACDGFKILIAVISDNSLGIYYAKPLIPITFHERNEESLEKYGTNRHVIWKPDSSKLAVITSKGCLLFYQVEVDTNNSHGIFNQIDPPSANLKRDSAELFIKEVIPSMCLKEHFHVTMDSLVTSISCISLTDIMVTTDNCKMIKLQWDTLEDGNENSTIVDLTRITFYMQQNSAHVPQKNPMTAYIKSLEYSPLNGGFAAVFSDFRAAFLSVSLMKFGQEEITGFWIPALDDATVCSINHKFRLLSFGRSNSEVAVYGFDDTTCGLEFSHKLSLSSKVYPGSLGAVCELKWTPDGCAIAVAWENGGISLWSTFGTLLMSSFSWDFGINVDLQKNNPLIIRKMEWSTEGYQLYLIKESAQQSMTNVLQLDFIKSTLSTNSCMTSNSHILLQSDGNLYINQGNNLEKIYFGSKVLNFPNNQDQSNSEEDFGKIVKSADISSILSESKYWTIVQLPLAYSSTNWPIRYSAIDTNGVHLAVAGRTGLAHYSLLTKKWKLFGNETQEKDFVVTGGLMWFEDFMIMGCFSLLERSDEIRTYPRDSKLDNQFSMKFRLRAPVILLNIFKSQLIVLTADGCLNIFHLQRNDKSLEMLLVQMIDIRRICIHPACIVSVTLKSSDGASAADTTAAETIILNVSGRILMLPRDGLVQGENKQDVINPAMVTCLASCVECFWLSNSNTTSHMMKDCLWLFSGAHGMRVWLPILPPQGEITSNRRQSRRHTFMSKRIMLSFSLKLYPLVILFDNVIVLGAENDTTLYANNEESHFSLPFSILERRSQVYLHKILRQLIKRNLGYSAWEIAKSCQDLPYFPHSLELLLHEVLEEEATSKDPIPDAQLPSILDFIREFPVYLQTIVQCARKTEIALWPYLFASAGKPKDLFQQCLDKDELQTAASYLIILQNLEPSTVSKEYATLLLDIALEKSEWELAKDLIRFLKAIDPNEVDSPRSSFIINNKIAPNQQQSQVNPDPDVFNLILGPMVRERSFSTTLTSKVLPPTTQPKLKANSTSSKDDSPSIPRKKSKEKKDFFFIETILQRHAKKLLDNHKIIELGYMSAFLDFHLVSWLSQTGAKIEDFIETLKLLHISLKLPHPTIDDNQIDPNMDLAMIKKSVFFGDVCRNASCHTSESGYFSLPPMANEINDHVREVEEMDVRHLGRFNSLPNGSGREQQQPGAAGGGKRKIPEKLEVKIRYLLQLFIESNCFDYALLLSIVLLDASSIGRIINVVIRSESIQVCQRIQNTLKKLTHWSFHERSGYRLFMMSIQPQLFMLDQYVTSKVCTVIKEEEKSSVSVVSSDNEILEPQNILEECDNELPSPLVNRAALNAMNAINLNLAMERKNNFWSDTQSLPGHPVKKYTSCVENKLSTFATRNRTKSYSSTEDLAQWQRNMDKYDSNGNVADGDGAGRCRLM